MLPALVLVLTIAGAKRLRDCDPGFMALQDVLNVHKDVCKSAQKQQQLVERCWFGQAVPKVRVCW